ncbi:MAG: hypothetical protein AAFX90_16630 [Pseudomonadota bacterium]
MTMLAASQLQERQVADLQVADHPPAEVRAAAPLQVAVQVVETADPAVEARAAVEAYQTTLFKKKQTPQQIVRGVFVAKPV